MKSRNSIPLYRRQIVQLLSVEEESFPSNDIFLRFLLRPRTCDGGTVLQYLGKSLEVSKTQKDPNDPTRNIFGDAGFTTHRVG
mmetsp:Transcript_36150/g.53929  ORF Transcript_36150/g.53929 Transcript_36150/m.53929 type:complete len:83 (+) Transcript_36150:354-602(+)